MDVVICVDMQLYAKFSYVQFCEGGTKKEGKKEVFNMLEYNFILAWKHEKSSVQMHIYRQTNTHFIFTGIRWFV